MQKSKILFQIFIWTILSNPREAKPTSNSERLHKRFITEPIPELSDVSLSDAIEVRTRSYERFADSRGICIQFIDCYLEIHE